MKRIFVFFLLFAVCLFRLAGGDKTQKYVLENDKVKVEFIFDGLLKLKDITDKKSSRNLIAAPSAIFKLNTPFVSVDEYKLVDAKLSSGKSLDISLAPKHPVNLKIFLRFELKDAVLNGGVKVQNTWKIPERLTLTFPMVKGVEIGEEPNDLWYCLPTRGGVIDNRSFAFDDPGHWGQYGELFPMQIIDVFNSKADCGLFLMSRDLSAGHKVYLFEKDKNADMGVAYTNYNVPGNGERSFPSFDLGVHDGDWKQAYNYYRNWVKSWRKPSPGQDWIKPVFVWERLYYFNDEEFKLGKEKYFSSQETMVDSGAWWWGKKYWEGLGDYEITMDKKELVENIRRFQKSGSKVGVYISPGLVYVKSKIYQKMLKEGKNWLVWDQQGRDIDYHTEPNKRISMAPEEYRRHLIKLIKERYDVLKFDFVYWDTQGYSIEHANRSYNPTYAKSIPAEAPLQDQVRLFNELRKELPPHVAFVTEFLGGDVYSQYVDGAITHFYFQNVPNAIPVNLFRFVFPGFKNFACFPEHHMKKKTDAELEGILNLILFNGDAIFTLQPKRWDKNKRSNIALMMSRNAEVMFRHADAFFGANPEPLIPTEKNGLLANRFTGSKSVVYTLYNRLEAPCEGVLLGIPDPENAVSVEKIAGNGEANFESGMIKGKVPAKQVLALKVVYSKMPVLKFSWSSDKKGLSLSGANDEKKKREKENGRAEAAID